MSTTARRRRTCSTAKIQGYTAKRDEDGNWTTGHVVDGAYCCDIDDWGRDRYAAERSAARLRRSLQARRIARRELRKAQAALSKAYSVLIASDEAWLKYKAKHALSAHSSTLAAGVHL